MQSYQVETHQKSKEAVLPRFFEIADGGKFIMWPKECFRTCNVLPFSCTHLALWRGKLNDPRYMQNKKDSRISLFKQNSNTRKITQYGKLSGRWSKKRKILST